uniref:C2H2-type domain-containing protein n=1 Tax=Amazona collaria TaxID=241587 RepID=A0A8B9FAX4_9PSIT
MKGVPGVPGKHIGFICPLCMKVCVTPTDLSEHYHKEHTGREGRQEPGDLPAVTVGLVCFVSIALVMGCFK